MVDLVGRKPFPPLASPPLSMVASLPGAPDRRPFCLCSPPPAHSLTHLSNPQYFEGVVMVMVMVVVVVVIVIVVVVVVVRSARQ